MCVCVCVSSRTSCSSKNSIERSHPGPSCLRTHSITLEGTHSITIEGTHSITVERTHSITIERTHSITIERTHSIPLQPRAPPEIQYNRQNAALTLIPNP